MPRVRYTLGFARIYGQEFPNGVWVEANAQTVLKVTGAEGWEVEGEEITETVEVVEETIEEVVEETVEVVDEVVDLSKLTKPSCASFPLAFRACFFAKNRLWLALEPKA